MKMKFIDPDQIFGTVLALIILAVGVFASFTVFANIPSNTPIGSDQRLGSNSYTQTNGTGAVHSLQLNETARWIPLGNTPINNSAACLLLGWTTASAVPHWFVLQTVGACNGTFIANGTYRIDSGTLHGTLNGTLRLDYPISGQQTSALSNSTYTAILNVSATSTSVFNIIGVVLIIAAIMAIVGLVYSYIKPRM